jgi:hypothetical protein
MNNRISTAFEGRVYPDHIWVLGPEEGVSFDKPNIKITLNASAVWSYEPVFISLYDGPPDETEPLIRWEIPNPPVDHDILFVDSEFINTSHVAYVVIDFADYAGVTVFELLGYD